jgi:hypothetical protein
MWCLFVTGLRATHLKNITYQLKYSKLLFSLSFIGFLTFTGLLGYYTQIMSPNVKVELTLAFVETKHYHPSQETKDN